MVISGEGKLNETHYQLQQKEDLYAGVQDSRIKELENHLSPSPGKVSHEYRTNRALQTNQVKGVLPKMCENVMDDVQQRQNDDEIHTSQNNQGEVYLVKESGNMQEEKLSSENSSGEIHLNQDSKKLENNLDGLNRTQSADAGNHPCQACEVAPENGSHATLPNQDHIVPKAKLHDLKQIEMHDGGINASVSGGKLIPEKRNHAPECRQVFLMPKKELDSLEQRQSSNTRIQVPASGEKKQADDSICSSSQFYQVSIIPKLEKEGSDQGQTPDSESHASATSEEGTVSTVLEKVSNTSLHCQSTNTQVSALPSDQEKLTYTVRPEKTLYKLQPRRNPESGARASQSEQTSMSPRVQEKVLDDGYNWRKYGQKLVKGNVFIRSYYKCTYANCLAKRQVERSYDGRLTDIKYIGKHEHPKPQNNPPVSAFVPPVEVKKVDMAVTTVSEADGEPSVAHQEISEGIEPTVAPRQVTAPTSNDAEVSKSHNSHDEIDDDDDDSPNAKKQKREISNVEDTLVKKTYCESRYVVQTISEVDIINDCYRWRKYGQKLVKGNPNPRSYYRCSNAGCPVKKHVERSSHDPKVVITTYEGKHDHDMPGSSSISQAALGTDINRKTIGGESRSENKPVGMEMAVHIGAT